jgi:hypothetical protein
MSVEKKYLRLSIKDLDFQKKYGLTSSQLDIMFYLLQLSSWAKGVGDFYFITQSKIVADLRLNTKTVEAAFTKLRKLKLIEVKLLPNPDWNKKKKFRTVKITPLGLEYNLNIFRPRDESIENIKMEIKDLKNKNIELEGKSVRLKNQNIELESETTELKNKNSALESKNSTLENKNIELEEEIIYLENIIMDSKIVSTEQLRKIKELLAKMEYLERGEEITDDIENRIRFNIYDDDREYEELFGDGKKRKSVYRYEPCSYIEMQEEEEKRKEEPKEEIKEIIKEIKEIKKDVKEEPKEEIREEVKKEIKEEIKNKTPNQKSDNSSPIKKVNNNFLPFKFAITKEFGNSGLSICNDVPNYKPKTEFVINSYNKLSLITPNKEYKQLANPLEVNRFWQWLFENRDRIGDVREIEDVKIEDLIKFVGLSIRVNKIAYKIYSVTKNGDGVKIQVKNSSGTIITIKNPDKGQGDVIDLYKCKKWFDLDVIRK